MRPRLDPAVCNRCGERYQGLAMDCRCTNYGRPGRPASPSGDTASSEEDRRERTVDTMSTKQEPIRGTRELPNRFYVGAPIMLTANEQAARRHHNSFKAGISGSYTVTTLDDAIELAKLRLEKEPNTHEVSVVQIIAIVRRGEQPVKVDTVIPVGIVDPINSGFGGPCQCKACRLARGDRS